MGRVNLLNGKVTEIYVEIINWNKFNPRKDVKHSSWFRFDHSIFEHPDFDDFTHSDMVTWLYLLSLASKCNGKDIVVHTMHAERLARINFKDLVTALHKLNKINAITFKHVTSTLRRRTDSIAHVTSTCSTRRDGTRRDGTRTNVGIRMSYPQEFESIWVKYGKRGDKKAAFDEWDKLNLTELEMAMLNRAIDRYVQNNELKFRKHLCRYLKTDWREVEPVLQGAHGTENWLTKTIDSIEDNSGNEGNFNHG